MNDKHEHRCNKDSQVYVRAYDSELWGWMMLHIYYQLAALVLTIMIAVLFAFKTRLLFDTDKAFSHLLLNILVVIILDIIAVYAMELCADGALAGPIAQWIGRAFMLSVVSVGYFSSRYTFVAIRSSAKNDFTLKNANVLPIVFCVVVAFFTDVNVQEQGSSDILYFNGSFVYISFLILVLYLLFSAMIIFSHRKQMEKQYFISATVFMVIIFCSVLITFFNPHYKILTFTMAIALLFMYLEMENPDDYVDCISGALNDYAFRKWGENLLKDRTEIGIFIVSVTEDGYIRKKIGNSEYERMLREMKQQMVKLRMGKVFRLDSGEFVYVVKSPEKESVIYEEMVEIISDISDRYAGLPADKVRYGVIPSLAQYSDMLAFSQDLRFFLKHLKTLSGDALHKLDDEALKVKNEEDFIVLSLKSAILENRIMVYYQPIYSTAKQRYTTAEALIRIKDLDGNFMSPERFIPIAEQRGYILTLGHAVFENVCRFIREQDLEGKGFDYIEINISTVQCMQKGLASELVSIMKEYSISPGFINLEITETAAIKSENTLIKNMQRLIELGVSFSLDDYGSGYSNLDYVIRMPFYLVKLDKLLVWSSFEQAKTKVLLETSVEMFKQMQLKIVAEGVETKEQAMYLAELGVDYLQGYFFSKPVSEEEFIKLVNSNTRISLQ